MSTTLSAPTNVSGTTQPQSAVYKYLDIDSTYRNRSNYPDPSSFVVPIQFPGRGSTASTAIDPVVLAVPFTSSTTKVPGQLETQTSLSNTVINLDPSEIEIDNYFINDIFQIYLDAQQQFVTITNYTYDDSGNRYITVSPALTSTPPSGTVYYTRQGTPFLITTVASSPTPTTTTFGLNSPASEINNLYANSYVRFTSGNDINQIALITAYNGATLTVTLATPLTVAPSPGDALELDSFSYDNASTLLYAGGVSNNNSQTAFYEIELLWLSVPNMILNTGYGGTLDRYPYVYVSLYNAGYRLSNQVMFSNNPNSTQVMFKVPVDQYFGDTSFLTLNNAKTKQVVRFETNSDIQFTISLPNGETVSYSEADTVSPLAPNPLLQTNALFALRLVSQ
jgi:hypothetical protein